MRSAAWLAAAAGIAGGVFSASSQAQPEEHYGYAWDGSSGEYLYTERHRTEIRDGRWQRGSIEYFDPAGQRLGVKQMDFSEHPYVPVFTLALANGYREGISAIDGDRVTMFRHEPGERREEKTLDLSKPMAADSGFHGLVVDHLDELMEGERKRFDFGVAGSLDRFSFRVRKTGETTFEGEPAIELKVEAATLLRLVAPSLELVYDPAAGRLLEYRGISNLQDPQTGRNYRDVRIRYLSEPPPEAMQAPGLAQR